MLPGQTLTHPALVPVLALPPHPQPAPLTSGLTSTTTGPGLKKEGKTARRRGPGKQGRRGGKEPGVSREVSRGGLAALREDRNPQGAGHPGRHESNPASCTRPWPLRGDAQCSAWHYLGGGYVHPSYKAEPPPLIASLCRNGTR